MSGRAPDLDAAVDLLHVEQVESLVVGSVRLGKALEVGQHGAERYPVFEPIGQWTTNNESARSNGANGRVIYRFHARDVHLVMGPGIAGKALHYRVPLDGKPPGAAYGGDVDEGANGTLDAPRMYQLIRQPGPIEDRTLEIEFLDAGAEVFVFTFG